MFVTAVESKVNTCIYEKLKGIVITNANVS